RVAVLPPEAMLERLQLRLPVLSHGARDAPARHHTLQATIAWSYDLLSESEQRLFRWLSVFRGGCTLAMAEAVCDSATAFDDLPPLIEHSRVQVTDDAAEPRYVMLVTVGVSASEQLEAAGESELARRRHAHAIVGLAEDAEPHLVSAERVPWLRRIDVE